VSSADKQGDNFSIPSQLRLMREWAEKQRYTIVAEFADKSSAWKNGLDRSELNKARQLARDKHIDMLMFYEPSRFTRDMADGVILRCELGRSAVRLFCFTPTPHEITRDNEIINIITDWRSQEYVEAMREASMRGYREKAEKGIFNGTRPPYGYKVEGRREQTRLLIVEEMAAVVRQIFHWFLYDRHGTHAIAKKLTKAGVPTPGESTGRNYARKRPPATWAQGTVHWLLTHEVYSGVWHSFRYQLSANGKRTRRDSSEWVTVTTDIPAIVDRTVWEAAQERLKRGGDHARNVKHNYLMRSRITCQCGAAMIGHAVHGGKNLYYRCGSVQTAAGKCPYIKHVSAPAVDAIVWDFAKQLLGDTKRLLQGYKDAQAAMNNEQRQQGDQIRLCEGEIERHSEDLGELIEMRQRTRVEAVKGALDEQIERKGEIIEQLQARRVALSGALSLHVITDQHIDEIAALADSVRDEIGDIEARDDFATKRRIVEAFNLRCTVHLDEDEPGGKCVDVLWLLTRTPRLLRSDTLRATRWPSSPPRLSSFGMRFREAWHAARALPGSWVSQARYGRCAHTSPKSRSLRSSRTSCPAATSTVSESTALPPPCQIRL